MKEDTERMLRKNSFHLFFHLFLSYVKIKNLFNEKKTSKRR